MLLPKLHQDSCFIDVILVSLFVPKTNYIDFHLLSPTELHRTISTKFVFGHSEEEDIQYRITYQCLLSKIVTILRTHTDATELTNAIVELRKHHSLNRLYHDSSSQQDAVSFLQQLLDILQINDNKLHANVYKKTGEEWVLSSSICNELNWIWDVLHIESTTNTSNLLQITEEYQIDQGSYKTYTYCTISHSVVIFYFHPPTTNKQHMVKLDEVIQEKYYLRSFVVYIAHDKMEYKHGHYVSFYTLDSKEWFKYDNAKDHAEKVDKTCLVRSSVLLAIYSS